MKNTCVFTHIASPLGKLVVTAFNGHLTGLYLPNQGFDARGQTAEPRLELFHRARVQLEAYFKGERLAFDLPLAPPGTDFQNLVWRRLCQIPFGQTMSYRQLAEAIGKPRASRAVGNANGKNPISIIIPCHRVVGFNGKLTGYAGGIEAKAWLLAHEQNQ